MAKVNAATDARILAGIDISKNRHEALIAMPGKTRRRRMTVLNVAADHQRLIETLRGFELPVDIGFEGQTMGLAATITARACSPSGPPASG